MMDLDIVRDIPGYQFILKTVLRSQILTLVEQLSQYTGEESFIMTTCVSDGTFSHLGSNDVKDFLEGRDDVKAQFMKHCIKKSITKSKQDPNSSTTTSAMSPDASFGTMPQPRIENPSTIPTQSEIHETDMSRYDQPTPVQLLRNTANTSTIEITPSTSFSGTMGKRVPKMPTRFTIDLKKNLSEKNSPGLKRSKTGQVQQTITSSFGIREARAVNTQNPCVSGAEKRVFTEIQDQGHNEQSAKKLKISHENFGLSSTVENVHSSVVGSESRLEDLSLISMKQELDDTDEAAYITSGDGDKTSTGNLSMTVFVEDMPSGSKKDTKTVPQVTSPILTGLRKKRKTSKFLQLDAIDCASEQELNAAIGEDDDGDQTKEAEDDDCVLEQTIQSRRIQPFNQTSNKKRRKINQTLAMKYNVLQELGTGNISKSNIARRYNIPLSTLSTWLKHAAKIEKGYQRYHLERKNCKSGRWEPLQLRLLDWCRQVKSRGERITSLLLLEKARTFADELNVKDFDGDQGWVERFKERHGIRFRSPTESYVETEDVNEEMSPNVKGVRVDSRTFNLELSKEERDLENENRLRQFKESETNINNGSTAFVKGGIVRDRKHGDGSSVDVEYDHDIGTVSPMKVVNNELMASPYHASSGKGNLLGKSCNRLRDFEYNTNAIVTIKNEPTDSYDD